MKYLIIILVCLFPFAISSQDLLLKIANPQVNGNQVTYDLSADNFTDMIAAQFSIRYDTSLMKFDSILNPILPGWDELSYFESGPGAIVIVWFELGVQGVTFANGTVLFQLLFESKDGSFGGVCFSQEPVESEFLTINGEVNSFFIIDDCHSEPFEVIINPTSTKDLVAEYGMTISSFIRDQNITFSLDDRQEIGFKVYDTNGSQVAAFSKSAYEGGNHSLSLNSSIVPGVFLLVVEIENQTTAVKLISIE